MDDISPVNATLAVTFADTDGDGMDDNWEEAYFGDISSSDGTANSDDDGFSDFQEYENRTNPVTVNEKGDINGDGDIGLDDAVLALQICAGMTSTVHKELEVSGDGKIGMEEVLYVLQLVSGIISQASESSDLGRNARVSNCGGFDMATTRDGTDDEYCRDERLIWQYDEGSQTASFLNKNVSLNCCGEHSVTVSLDKETGVYEISETDKPIGGMGRCSCLCFFDFGIDLPDIISETVRIKLSRLVIDYMYPYSMWEYPDSEKIESYSAMWEGELDLSGYEGDVLISENGGYCR